MRFLNCTNGAKSRNALIIYLMFFYYDIVFWYAKLKILLFFDKNVVHTED